MNMILILGLGLLALFLTIIMVLFLVIARNLKGQDGREPGRPPDRGATPQAHHEGNLLRPSQPAEAGGQPAKG
jgi:hypothetical protein